MTYLQLFIGIVIVMLFCAVVIWVRRTFFATTISVYVETAVGIFGLVVIIWLLLTALGLMPLHDPKVPQLR